MGSSHKPAEVVYLFVLLGDAFYGSTGLCVAERRSISFQICVDICVVQVYFLGAVVGLGRFELSTHLQRRSMSFQLLGRN